MKKKQTKIDFVRHYGFIIEKTEEKLDEKMYNEMADSPVMLLNWIIPDMGEGSGGHINIFRFISGLEERGFHSRIYLYRSEKFKDDREIRRFLWEKFPGLDARAEIYQDVRSMTFAHGTIATSWDTAYCLRRFHNTISKFYFVQDYEPYFYARGSEFEMAKRTYQFGFRGIFAGDWLKGKLWNEFGMRGDSYRFSYDREVYRRGHKTHRKNRIFFYARPVTPRRDFELGIVAIARLLKRLPDTEVVLAGWDVKEIDIPFPYTDLGILDTRHLSDVYADCDLCLVLSHTNLSLLPLEIMASGSVAVCSKGDNSTWLLNEENSVLVEFDVEEIAKRMEYYLTHKEELAAIREAGFLFAQGTSWEEAIDKVQTILVKGIEDDKD